MKITGVIAEFNPFHNGHAYLLQKAREQAQADLVAVIMSGDFVQRGAPALLSKYARAEAALRCGADLVIELPIFASCASAEYFAEGAMRLLSDLNIDSFCFGAESGCLENLDALAKLLASEPEEYRTLLKKHLASGENFPTARRAAVAALLPETMASLLETTTARPEATTPLQDATPPLPDTAALLDEPNNLLAIEYLKACHKHHWNIQPHCILRTGSSYHEIELIAGTVPSASALRSIFSQEAMPLSLAFLADYMPIPAFEILERELFCTFPVLENDFSNLICYQLLHTPLPKLDEFADMSQELANRIYSRRSSCVRTGEFILSLKTKELTYTRISRALFHAVLQITAKEQEAFRAFPHSPYARILGLSSAARPFLRECQNHALVPLITKPAKAKKILSAEAYSLFEKDIAASELYRQISFARYQTEQPSEFTHEILIME